MIPTSPAYDDAVTQAERQPVASVTADWDRNGTPDPVAVSTIRVDRSLVSDLPGDVTLVSGHSVAQASLTLAGDPTDSSQDAIAIYSPYLAGAVLADVDVEGAPATVHLGLQTSAGPELLPAINGVGSVMTLNAANRTVTYDILDFADRLRFTPSLPPVIGLSTSAGVALDVFGLLRVQLGGLNAQWVVHHISRQGGFFATPPPMPGAIYSATLNGSLQPEIGDIVDARMFITLLPFLTLVDRVSYAQGQFGLAPTPRPGWATQLAGPLAKPTISSRHTIIAAWINVLSAPGLGSLVSLSNAADDQFELLVDFSGAMGLVVRTATDAFVMIGPAGISPGWHYIGVDFTIDSATKIVSAVFRVDGVSTGPVTRTLTTVPAALTDMLMQSGPAIESLQVANSTTPAVWQDNFTPNGALEPSRLELTATPPLSGSLDAWGVLQQIAATELGAVLLDEDGVLRYWSRDHWGADAAASTVQRTLDATTALTDLQITRTSERIRNHISIAVAPLTIGDLQIIWQPTETLRVPPLDTLIVFADLGQAQAYHVVTDTEITVPGGAMVNKKSGYRAAKKLDGTGGEIRNLTMSVSQITGTTIKISITNPNAFEAWLVSPTGVGYPTSSDGTPALSVVGALVSPTSTQLDGTEPVGQSGTRVDVSWQPSIDRYGARTLEIPASPWMQSTDTAAALANDMLSDLAWPTPQLSPVTIVPDVALQLGDRIQIVDAATGVDDPFWVVGITTDFDAQTYRQTLTLRPVGPPRSWLLGVAGRSELGITTRL